MRLYTYIHTQYDNFSIILFTLTKREYYYIVHIMTKKCILYESSKV